MHVSSNTKDSKGKLSDLDDESIQSAVFDADTLESCENASTEQSLKNLHLRLKQKLIQEPLDLKLKIC